MNPNPTTILWSPSIPKLISFPYDHLLSVLELAQKLGFNNLVMIRYLRDTHTGTQHKERYLNSKANSCSQNNAIEILGFDLASLISNQSLLFFVRQHLHLLDVEIHAQPTEEIVNIASPMRSTLNTAKHYTNNERITEMFNGQITVKRIRAYARQVGSMNSKLPVLDTTLRELNMPLVATFAGDVCDVVYFYGHTIEEVRQITPIHIEQVNHPLDQLSWPEPLLNDILTSW